MRSRLVRDHDPRLLVVVCDKEDNPVECVVDAAREQGIRAAQVTAVGAFRRAQLGYFDRTQRDYTAILVDEQAEVLSFLGDIATKADEPVLHAHVVLGRQDGSTIGGHLLAGTVWPALEVMVTEVADELGKQVDPETGLALIRLD